MGDHFLLVLTATITPAANVSITRKDPRVRKADYLRALSFWLNHADSRFTRILFAENSGADLTDFQDLADKSGKEVELISIPLNPPPPEMHYGFSEFEMIDQALTQSRLREQTTHLIKVTGRLTFPALPRLLDRLPPGFQVAVDARARLPFRPSEHGFVSIQLLLAKHDFYDSVLRKGYQQLKKAFHYPNQVEHLFFELLMPLRGQAGVFLRFPVNCEPIGFPAHKAERYNNTAGIIKGRARAILRVVAPDFWF